MNDDNDLYSDYDYDINIGSSNVPSSGFGGGGLAPKTPGHQFRPAPNMGGGLASRGGGGMGSSLASRAGAMNSRLGTAAPLSRAPPQRPPSGRKGAKDASMSTSRSRSMKGIMMMMMTMRRRRRKMRRRRTRATRVARAKRSKFEAPRL